MKNPMLRLVIVIKEKSSMYNHFSRRRIIKVAHCLGLSVLTIATITGASVAQTISTPDENALMTDAMTYAKDFGVSQEEALRRLRLQEDIGNLTTILSEEESDTFAGLWIEHTPQYRVVARVTSPSAKEALLKRVRGTELESLIEVTSARFSQKELANAQNVLQRIAKQSAIPMESEINLQANRVRFLLLDPNLFENVRQRVKAGLDLTPELSKEAMDNLLNEGIEVIQVDRLSTPEADIYGGLPLRTCTSSFPVLNSSGTRGVTTAAHCNNSQSYLGTNLQFQAEDQQGNQDFQWHTTPGFTVTNQFNSGVGIRRVTATRSRANQSVGNYVCKNGKTTGYTCGNITTLNYAPSYVTDAQATFIRVSSRDNVDLSQGGDSGGPWFNSGTAYGIHSGGIGNDSLYMAIDYISSLGVSVLTSP
jgi:hypothetical protein